MHNLRGNKPHMIIQDAFAINRQIRNHKIDGTPDSNEQTMAFSIGDLKFVDNFQFMASNLDNLVSNLYDNEGQFNNFTHIKSQFRDHMDLLCTKGYLPIWLNKCTH